MTYPVGGVREYRPLGAFEAVRPRVFGENSSRVPGVKPTNLLLSNISDNVFCRFSLGATEASAHFDRLLSIRLNARRIDRDERKYLGY